MPGIEVRVGDPETCEELPRGEVGEILCRGYNIMKGYYKMPEDTARAISRKAGCTPATWASWTSTATCGSRAGSRT